MNDESRHWHARKVTHFDSVPPEILFRIFRDALRAVAPTDHARQLTTITQVCTLWRAVALEYQHLWTYIYLPCNEEYLEIALRRSGDSPLRIFHPVSRETSRGFSFKFATEFSLNTSIRRVLQEAPRIRQLSFRLPEAIPFTEIALCRFLEVLIITSAGGDHGYTDLDSLKTLLRSLPCLRFFRLPLYSTDKKPDL